MDEQGQRGPSWVEQSARNVGPVTYRERGPGVQHHRIVHGRCHLLETETCEVWGNLRGAGPMDRENKRVSELEQAVKLIPASREATKWL